ncbi:putative Zinc finger, FYVE/PHD-type, Zinc finger, RING/FYVE/PHD-type [Helianthus anomalus]
MYILCQSCNNWFHAESVDFQMSKVMEVYGYKCCRCRRIRIPICPYMDFFTRERLERKKLGYNDPDLELASD